MEPEISPAYRILICEHIYTLITTLLFLLLLLKRMFHTHIRSTLFLTGFAEWEESLGGSSISMYRLALRTLTSLLPP